MRGLDLVHRAVVDHDGLDTGPVQEVGEHQPGGAAPHDRHLGTRARRHGGHVAQARPGVPTGRRGHVTEWNRLATWPADHPPVRPWWTAPSTCSAPSTTSTDGCAWPTWPRAAASPHRPRSASSAASSTAGCSSAATTRRTSSGAGCGTSASSHRCRPASARWPRRSCRTCRPSPARPSTSLSATATGPSTSTGSRASPRCPS